MSRRRQLALRLAEYPVEQILPITNLPDLYYFDFVVGGKTYSVKMHSKRFGCFRESLACVCCGLRGTKMILEFGSPNAGSPHFNLYGERDGGLVLMTKDHVIPASVGGSSRPSNLQTMCATCNRLKGAQRLTNHQLRALRESRIPAHMRHALAISGERT